MRRYTFLLAAVSLFAVGCEDFNLGEWDRFREDFQYSYDVNPGVRVYLETMNGSVEVTSWEKDSIQITGTKRAGTESALKALRIDVVASADAVRIRTVAPSGHRGSWGASYVLRVPAKAVLEQLDSSNGAIRIEGVDGPARVRTSNGSVKAFRVAGPLEARTSNASVEMNDIRSGVTVITSNGSVRGSGLRGPVDASSSNASINITLDSPEARRPVRLNTSNGSVELAIANLRENDVRIGTSNSSITLRLPGGIAGLLKARTSNASIHSDFDVSIRAGELKKNWLEGTIGGGGPVFDLTTSNGSIRIVRM
jgi:DUF4097 and DUF4098 domain-containing protein YvlB